MSFGTAISCQKAKPFTKKLTPGLNLYWCTICHKAKGFQIMVDAESPRTCFNYFVTRCLTAPKLFVRDDGCHDQAFCLNREPVFYKDTEFAIDQPHKKGHVSCAKAYDTQYYPGRIKNAPLAEQKNSALKHLR